MSKVVFAALTANGSIAIAKTVGAIFTGSASLAAEAIHSFADCGNQLLLLWGSKTSDRDADTNHPLGYGMNVYFWSFIVALVLFTLGGVYSIYEGVHKVLHPEPLKFVGWAFGILTFGFVMELRSFLVCLKEIKEEYGGKSLKWFFRETRSPELLVVFGEDLAALLGLGIAAVFLGLAAVTNNPVFDAIGSVAVGTLLVLVAIGLFIETKALLIGQSVDPITRRKLHALLADMDEVVHTFECITYQMGEEAILLLRCRMRESDSVDELLDDLNAVEYRISQEFPIFKKIFIEPDDKFEDIVEPGHGEQA